MGLLSRFRSQAEVAPATLWRRGDFTTLPLGTQFVTAQRRGRPVLTVPAFLAEFIHECEDFQPLEQAVARHADRHGWDSTQAAALKRLLPQAASDGLLLSTEDLRQAAAREAGTPPPPISTLALSTGGDRLPLLERAVRGFAENLRAHSRTATLLIAENSPDPAQTARCREALTAWGRDFPEFPFAFLGHSEKRALAGGLVRAGACSAETAEFALFDPLRSGFSLGANRNALLLRTAGEMFASLDDDAVCRFAAPPVESDSTLACISETDPYHRWLYASRAEAFATTVEIEADYLGTHEQMLGRDAGTFFAPGDRIDFSRTGDALVQRLLRGPARVRATYAGHLGDPGIPASAYYLYYDGENRARLTESESHYRSVFPSRSVLAVSPVPALTDAMVCPGIAMALDHRELLPPFFPVLHAEDYSWGAVLWRSCPGALLGHLPVALRHEPPDGKSILTPGDLRTGRPFVFFEFAHLLRQLVFRPSLPETGSAAERLGVLGRSLCEAGQLPPADFQDFLREQALIQASERIAYLAQEVEDHLELPVYWQEDVHGLLEHLQSSVTGADFEIPLDLQSARPAAETRCLIQTLLARYGEMLLAWPAMVQTAATLRPR